MAEETKERTINELMDLSYSEMSDEEIERVIEFRAYNKARDSEFAKRMEQQRIENERIRAINLEIAETAQKQLEAMTAQAIENLKIQSVEVVSNG